MITTIAELFYEALRHDLPEWISPKFIHAYVPISSREVQARVERVALALKTLGILTGDRVAILSENRPEWAFADYACALLGIVSAPVYPTLAVQQTVYIIRHSGARLIFCSTRAQLDKVLEGWSQLAELEMAVLMEGEAPEVPGRRILTWAQVLAMGEAREAERPQVRLWAKERTGANLLTLIYTSGTTGEPKGAMLTHGNVASNVSSVLAMLDIRPGLRCLSILPLSHIFERMGGHYTLFSAGVAIYYLDDLNNLVAAFGEVRPHVLLAVPRVFEKVYARIREAVHAGGLVKRWIFHWALWLGQKVAAYRYKGLAPRFPLSLGYAVADKLVFSKLRERMGGRIEITVSGGAALGIPIMEFFWAAGIPIYEGYGLSETAPVISLNEMKDVRPGYVGRPIMDTWQGRPFVKLGEDGEILCQGPNVTPGYWNDPFATEQAFDPEGYFRTGDIGALDEEGRLRITDRKKELLVTSGGKNVAPQPIERMLAMDKYIAQAVVIGDRRNFLSAVIVANLPNLRRWADKAGLQGLSDADLVAHPQAYAKVMSRIERINAQLSNYERIRKIVLLCEEMTLDSGLLTPSLKVKRKAVNERYGERIEALYEGSQG